MIDPEILRRIEANGALTRIRNAQSSVLNQLLNDQRFARLIEQQTIDGTAAYTAAELLSTVRKGVWKELDAPTVKIDAYRRNLQNAYLELVNTKLNGATAAAGRRGGGRWRTRRTRWRAGAERRREAVLSRRIARAEHFADGGDRQSDRSRHEGASGRGEGSDRENSRSEVPASGARGRGGRRARRSAGIPRPLVV